MTIKKDNPPPAIEINPQFARALELIETSDQHLFITGRAGTGKSTFLQYFRDSTEKNIVFLAPTGVAAVNIKGQTIHSFFNFKPDITPEAVSSLPVHPRMEHVYRNLDTIVIDEISMVRADLLDCVDAFLRRRGPREDRAFGGVQMVFIGDLFQLAPVVLSDEEEIFRSVYPGPYFFNSRVFEQMDMKLIEFEKNYRQKDEGFISLLNRVRNNTVRPEDIDRFNERCEAVDEMGEFSVYLTTTNKIADGLNYDRLHNLKAELFTNDGEVKGDFEAKSLPTQPTLELKVGAQVMLLNNDSARRWVNGSIGKVIDLIGQGAQMVIQVELAGGDRVEVEPFTWEIYRFYFDEARQMIDAAVVGSFRQFPLKLAWALTIHKSQGQTFDQVVIDLGKGTFCHGQLYVALSRCRTLEGIILKRPIVRRDILVDRRVCEFLKLYQLRQSENELSPQDKRALIEQAIRDQQVLEITYIKDNEEKSHRRIVPRAFKKIEYNGQLCEAVEAFWLDRETHWVFRLSHILEMRVSED